MQAPSQAHAPPSAPKAQALRSILLAGILPVVAFTVIEEYYGVIWGLIAGMVFGVGEIFWEWIRQRRIETLTWAGNALLLAMGGISLLTQDGIWFKLQPALIEAALALAFVISVMMGKPLMAVLMSQMMKKQGLQLNTEHPRAQMMMVSLKGVTFRVGVFFALHAALATWAALAWSTTAWAFLKGLGFTGSMLVYMVIEGVFLRRKMTN